MTTNCQTYDQTVSQTGWSNTVYASGAQASYTVQSALNWDTTYYWRSYAVDQLGSDVWSDTQASPYSFTTNRTPSAPTNLEAEGTTNPTGIIDPTPEFSAIYDDLNTSDTAIAYQIEVNTASNFTGTVMWDSGKVSISALNEGTRSALIPYAGTGLSPDTTYYWRIKFWDSFNVEGVWSSETASITNGSIGDLSSCTLEEGPEDDQITIHWEYGVGYPGEVEIQKNVDSAGFSALTTSTPPLASHVDSNISTTHTYQYRLRVAVGGDYSNWCTTALLNLDTGTIMFENVNFD